MHAKTHTMPLPPAAPAFQRRPSTYHTQPSACGGSYGSLLVELTAELQQPPHAAPLQRRTPQ